MIPDGLRSPTGPQYPVNTMFPESLPSAAVPCPQWFLCFPSTTRRSQVVSYVPEDSAPCLSLMAPHNQDGSSGSQMFLQFLDIPRRARTVPDGFTCF